MYLDIELMKNKKKKKMNKYEEAQKIDSLFEVESGLDTRLFELAGYPLIEDLVEKMFQLKEQMTF